MAGQIELGDAELRRLGQRVEEDYLAAIADHDERMKKWGSYYQRWRSRYDPPSQSEPDAPNFRVPLVKWHVVAKLSKEIEALFGDDSEVRAQGTGPSDMKRVKKVGLFMTWRLFQSMKIVKPFITFALRKILFGRAHAYAPWRRIEFSVPIKSSLIQKFIHFVSRGKFGADGNLRLVAYEGPVFEPLSPDDFIVPAEEVDNLHDFTFVIRRYEETAGGFFEGMGSEYQDNTGEGENLRDLIMGLAQEGDSEDTGNQIHDEVDLADNVFKRNAPSRRDSFPVIEWYGKWRMLLDPEDDADEYDLDKRELAETQLIVRYSRDLNRIVGIQNLDEMYPLSYQRRPFVEASMPGDSYWPAGFGETLAEIEAEITATSQLGVEAGQYSVGPLIFYRPGVGEDPDQERYEPFQMVPTDDPTGVKVVTFSADLSFIDSYTNFLMGLAERLGVSDLSMGCNSDRPNSPKTVGQTVALLDESNVRFALDNRVFREDFARMLEHFWNLEIQFLPARQFFRVTEEKAEGLFPVEQGGAWMERADRMGTYDFQIKLATSAVNKEVERTRALELFSLDMANPLIAMNPVALWKATNRLHEAMGDPDFRDLIPQPPEPDRSMSPKEEMNMVMQGEPITISPLDDDKLHIQGHMADIEWLGAQDPVDERTIQKLQEHIPGHFEQIRQKMMMQQLAQKAAQDVAAMLNQGRDPAELLGGFANGGTAQPGRFGAAA